MRPRKQSRQGRPGRLGARQGRGLSAVVTLLIGATIGTAIGCGAEHGPAGPTLTGGGAPDAAVSGGNINGSGSGGNSGVVGSGGNSGTGGADTSGGSGGQITAPSPDAGAPAGDAAVIDLPVAPRPDAAADTMAPKTDMPLKPLPTLPWPAANAIVAAVPAPTFPDRQCALDKYGGKGDGTTDNTAAFAAAIADCNKMGGGHVVVPPGNYLTGAIALLDNIDLSVGTGATLLFSGDEASYPLVLTRYQGIELMNRSPMIYAYQRQNIAVTGAGTLDATATASWNKTDSTAFDMLVAWGDAGTPVKDRVLPDGVHLRTSTVMPYASKKVLLQGFRVTGSPFWMIHPTLSSSVLVRDVAASAAGPETVGLVIESSDNVVVANGTFTTGSDCIALKSGRDADGRRVNAPSKNVVVVQARCQGAGGLISIGSESTAGVQGVYGYDLGTTGTSIDNVVLVKSTPTRGGVVDSLFFDTVAASKLRGALLSVNLNFAGATTGDFPPKVGAATFSHVSVDGAARVISIAGMPAASPVGPIAISDGTFINVANAQSTLTNAMPVTYTRVTVNGVAPVP